MFGMELFIVPQANFYGRLDGSAYFKTAMTAPKPHGKKYFIHPSVCDMHLVDVHPSYAPQQKRALSLREFARSQGFPDGYTLCSSEFTPAARLQDVSHTHPGEAAEYLGLAVLQTDRQCRSFASGSGSGTEYRRRVGL